MLKKISEKIFEAGESLVESANNLVDDIIVYCFQQKMPEGVIFIEIPSNQRNPLMPERFRNSIGSSTPCNTRDNGIFTMYSDILLCYIPQ